MPSADNNRPIRPTLLKLYNRADGPFSFDCWNSHTKISTYNSLGEKDRVSRKLVPIIFSDLSNQINPRLHYYEYVHS